MRQSDNDLPARRPALHIVRRQTLVPVADSATPPENTGVFGDQPGIRLALISSVSHAHADPLARLGREYSRLVRPLVRAMSPVAASRGDRAVVDALDTAEALCDAVWTSIQHVLQLAEHSDDTGIAVRAALRLAERAIDESRDAWVTLTAPGHAIGNGVPAQLLRRLDELSAALAARFQA